MEKFFLTAVLTSGVVFFSLTLPFAVLGSKQVTIQVQDKPLFNDKLKEIAVPYLGLATALSMASGITAIAVTGWWQSSRESVLSKSNLSNLQQQLQDKATELEELSRSDSQSLVLGLSAFLTERVSAAEPVSVAATNGQQSVVVEMPIKVIEPQDTSASEPEAPKPSQPHLFTITAAASSFGTAQAALSITPEVKLIK